MAWSVNPNDGTSHTTTARLTGNGTDWSVQTYRTGVVSDTQQARVAFKLSQTGSGAVVALESSDAANYIGVYENQGTLYLRTRVGASFTNQLTLLSGLDTTAWYVLELAVDDASGFRATVWAESAPSVRYEMRWEMPTGQQTWRFHAWGSGSTVTSLDNYQEGRPSLKATDVRYAGQHYEDDRGPTPSVTKRYYAEGDAGGDAEHPQRQPQRADAAVRAGGSPGFDEHADGRERQRRRQGAILGIRGAETRRNAADDGPTLHRPAVQQPERILPLQRRQERRPLLRPAPRTLRHGRQHHTRHWQPAAEPVCLFAQQSGQVC
ncbi:MAG: hypothetical protein U0641_19075 [Anaerolineae bacterium]